MKVGDLVVLSSAGFKQSQNGLVKDLSNFGIIVKIDNHGTVTTPKPFFRVKWFLSLTARARYSSYYEKSISEYGHWRYEIKKYKKST